jgi:hypothetical protein
MTYSAQILSDTLRFELEKGFDVIRIARVAFQIYQEHGLELTPELDDIILQLMAMEDGPEFAFSEDEFQKLIEKLANRE